MRFRLQKHGRLGCISIPRVLIMLAALGMLGGMICGVGGIILPAINIPPQDSGDWLNLCMMAFGVFMGALVVYDIASAMLSSYPRRLRPEPRPRPRHRSPAENTADSWTRPVERPRER